MTYYELLQALKPYHSFIYTGDKLSDLDLIEEDVKELRRLGLIEQPFFRDAMLVISKERQQLRTKREG